MLLNKRLSVGYFASLIKYDVIAVAIYAILAGSFDHIWIFKNITIPLPISAFIGTLLSLLLAFRTSQSYERWWEARVVWGGIVNDSRTLVRQIQFLLPRTENIDTIASAFAKRQVAWCVALCKSLRRLPYPAAIQDYIDQENIDAKHLANTLLSEHSRQLRDLSETVELNPNKQVQIDSTVLRLCDAMGKCERIKNTIFPKAYSLLIHFLIYVFMSILPFGLEDQSKFVEIGLTFVIPVLFIMIERTAILMQDPFENNPTDTPMDALSKTIESNLSEMTGYKIALAEPAKEYPYYIL